MPLLDVAHDIADAFYVAGQSGEPEENLPKRHVYVYASDVRDTGIGRPLRRSDAAVQQKIARTIQLNYWMLVSHPEIETPTNTQCLRIAYIRGWCLALGLLDTANNPAEHNVLFNDVQIVNDLDERGDFVNVLLDTEEADGDNPAVQVNPKEVIPPGWAEDADWRRSFKPKLSDVICELAFFMRTRANHWKVEFKQRFSDIWRKCLYDEDDPGLGWDFLCHHALHAIYPDVLDDFWRGCVDTERCAGALIKRWHSYAAGQAAFGAVKAGADDITVVFPRLRDVIPDAFVELDRCKMVLDAPNGRWAGSINRRFYKAPNFTVDERALAPLAAVIQGALEMGTVVSSLKDSPALKRVGSLAPITGSVINNILLKAAQNDRMVYAVLPESAEEGGRE